MPIRRIRSGCCAPAGSGQIAAVLPSPAMNSRRRIDHPLTLLAGGRSLPGLPERMETAPPSSGIAAPSIELILACRISSGASFWCSQSRVTPKSSISLPH
jgi:hypothetical protein